MTTTKNGGPAVIARARRLWSATSWVERFVTVMTPIMPVLALFVVGSVRETVAWTVAGLWWSNFLNQKFRSAELTREVRLMTLRHQLLIGAVNLAAEIRRERAHAARARTSSVRIGRAHR